MLSGFAKENMISPEIMIQNLKTCISCALDRSEDNMLIGR